MRLRRDLGRCEGEDDDGGDVGGVGFWLVARSAGPGCWAGSFMTSRVVRRRKRRECTLEGLEGLEAFLWKERKTAQIRMIFFA